jgi:hypothetical protein
METAYAILLTEGSFFFNFMTPANSFVKFSRKRFLKCKLMLETVELRSYSKRDFQWCLCAITLKKSFNFLIKNNKIDFQKCCAIIETRKFEKFLENDVIIQVTPSRTYRTEKKPALNVCEEELKVSFYVVFLLFHEKRLSKWLVLVLSFVVFLAQKGKRTKE